MNHQNAGTNRPITILLTGATSGIGLALARQYQTQGARLLAVGRRALAELDGDLFTASNYCALDLAKPSAAASLSEWLAEHDVQALDLVLHNAASGYIGRLADQSPNNIQELLNLNLYAPLLITHRLQQLVAAENGKFAYIGSVVDSLPAADYAVYAATKAAIAAFVRNFQIELEALNSPIHAQLIRPGATRTAMHSKAGAAPGRFNYARFAPPEQVASQIHAALATSQRTSTLGTGNRLIHWACRMLPGLALAATARSPHTRQAGEALLSEKSVEAASPHCVITGAASGIGRSLAMAFARAGYRITAIDVDREVAMRTQAELINGGASARFIIGDLGRQSELPNMVELLRQRGPIDCLIHNAGINSVGPFLMGNIEDQMAVLNVNLAAPLLLNAELFHQRLLAPGASLLFLSSLSHFVSYPGAAVYAATKSGLHAYAAALRAALQPHGLHVLTVYPGPTRTDHARRYSPDNRRENHRMHPDKLAGYILRAVQQKHHQLIPGSLNGAAALLGTLLPAAMEKLMRKTLLEPMLLQLPCQPKFTDSLGEHARKELL
jgi:short-subunit dehydrogenase